MVKKKEPLRMFESTCNCGGFAWSMNGRDPASPHMHWCPQYAEYAKWWKEEGREQLEQRNREKKK